MNILSENIPRKAQLLIVLFSLSLSGCSASRHISSQALSEKIERQDPLLIIDTRSRYEFNKGHITGAVHIPFWKSPFIKESSLDCNDKMVVIYCEHGPRAGVARFFLEGELCPDIYYLQGHLKGWKQQDLPLHSSKP